MEHVHHFSTEVANQMARFAPALFLVWLMIASAYMPELAGCQMRRLLGSSMIAKHAVGLIMVYFSVVLIAPGISDINALAKNIIYAVCIYTWFVLTTRCPYYVILAIVIIAFQTYILHQQLLQEGVNQITETRKKDIQRLILRLSIISMTITALGVYLYATQKMQEHGDQFSYWYFFVGRMQCDSLRPGSPELIEPI